MKLEKFYLETRGIAVRKMTYAGMKRSPNETRHRTHFGRIYEVSRFATHTHTHTQQDAGDRCCTSYATMPGVAHSEIIFAVSETAIASEATVRAHCARTVCPHANARAYLIGKKIGQLQMWMCSVRMDCTAFCPPIAVSRARGEKLIECIFRSSIKLIG